MYYSNVETARSNSIRSISTLICPGKALAGRHAGHSVDFSFKQRGGSLVWQSGLDFCGTPYDRWQAAYIFQVAGSNPARRFYNQNSRNNAAVAQPPLGAWCGAGVGVAVATVPNRGAVRRSEHRNNPAMRVRVPPAAVSFNHAGVAQLAEPTTGVPAPLRRGRNRSPMGCGFESRPLHFLQANRVNVATAGYPGLKKPTAKTAMMRMVIRGINEARVADGRSFPAFSLSINPRSDTPQRGAD